MTRVFLIFMMALLPFQFVWGAAASYCQHEQGSATEHFGHHTHKHLDKAVKASGESTADKKSFARDDDTDCAFCHLGWVAPVTSTAASVGTLTSSSVGTAVAQGYPPHLSYSIERPNWTLAA